MRTCRHILIDNAVNAVTKSKKKMILVKTKTKVEMVSKYRFPILDLVIPPSEKTLRLRLEKKSDEKRRRAWTLPGAGYYSSLQRPARCRLDQPTRYNYVALAAY